MPHHANRGSFVEKDYTGYRFENGYVIEKTGKKSKNGMNIWLCRCNCGNVFEVESYRITRIRSCGCLTNTSYRKDNCEEISGEEWKRIDGFDNYEVSNFGRIKSNNYLGKGVTRIVKPSQDAKGYLRITLSKDGKRYTRKVHRIVAAAFVHKDSDDKKEVNHIDGNKGNNNASNLEWVTAKQNLIHAYRTGLKDNNIKWATKLGNTIGKEKLKEEREKRKMKVLAINVADGTRIECDSQAEASEKTGVPQANIHKVIYGKRKHAGGYTFEMVKEGD